MLRQALEIDPAYAEAHHNLGRVLARQGRAGEAIDSYREALGRNPSLASAENDLGTALAGLGRIDEAMEHWRRALAIDPRKLSALFNLGAALIQRGEHGEAIDRLRGGAGDGARQLAFGHAARVGAGLGASPGAARPRRGAISGDGRYVAFTTFRHFADPASLAELLELRFYTDRILSRGESAPSQTPSYQPT